MVTPKKGLARDPMASAVERLFRFDSSSLSKTELATYQRALGMIRGARSSKQLQGLEKTGVQLKLPPSARASLGLYLSMRNMQMKTKQTRGHLLGMNPVAPHLFVGPRRFDKGSPRSSPKIGGNKIISISKVRRKK
jgi:hypothetical protein